MISIDNPKFKYKGNENWRLITLEVGLILWLKTVDEIPLLVIKPRKEKFSDVQYNVLR